MTNTLYPGQAHCFVISESTAAVEAIVMENRCVTVDEIAVNLNISHGSAHHMIHDVLRFHKVSAEWVSQQLTPELEERCIDFYEELL